MNKVVKFFKLVLLTLFVLTFSFCSSAEKTDAPNPPSTTDSGFDAKKEKEAASQKRETEIAVVEDPTKKSEESGGSKITANVNYSELFDELNAKIKEIRYPDGKTVEGFEYKRWDIPNQKDFVNWLKTSASVLRDVLEKLPENVKLEIIGHADTTGPETREGNKLGNIYYSKKRADEVKKYIVKVFKSEKVGIKNLDSRLITKGVGSSEPIPGIEGTSAKNRRVTFNLVDTSQKFSNEGKSGEVEDLDSTK